MPIHKVPIVHKFGIISHSQRVELQERLLRQSLDQTVSTHRMQTVNRNPLEVTEGFIHQYNDATDYKEKERLDDKARKMLLRIRRRTGLKDGGIGDHVNLPMAWSELAMLAQCKGKVQEECLEVLITSLDQAPLSAHHIPSLFFLAETTLYWLRTDAVNQPFLRTAELKLLKMGQLTFTRLLYHHLVGHLEGQAEFKNRLVTYLDGFSECQEAYSPYPGAHLALRFISEVGRIIIGRQAVDPGELKEGDKGPTPDARKQTPLPRALTREQTFTSTVPTSGGVHDVSPTLWHALDVWRCVNNNSRGLKQALHGLAECGMGLANESWLDGVCAINIVAEASRQNVRALRTLQDLARGMDPNIAPTAPTPDEYHSFELDLSEPADSLKSEPHLGEDITGEDTEPELLGVGRSRRRRRRSRRGYESGTDVSATSVNKSVSVTAIASTPPDRHVMSFTSESGPSRLSHISAGSEPVTEPEISSRDSLDSAGGIMRHPGIQALKHDGIDTTDSDLEPGEDSEIEPSQDNVLQDSSGKTDERNGFNDDLDVKITEMDLNRATQSAPGGMLPLKKPIRKSLHSHDMHRPMGSQPMASLAEGQTQESAEVIPDTAHHAEMGSEFPEGRDTAASEKLTFANLPLPEVPGIAGWRWEVAYVFTEALGYVSLHGITSQIQKLALVGVKNPSELVPSDYNSACTESAGLLDLAEFNPQYEVEEEAVELPDWMWRVRYGAVQSLVKVGRCCQADKTKEGVRTAVWGMLVRVQSQEQDVRVMEAFKVGQVEAEVETSQHEENLPRSSTIFAKMAHSLAEIYLPPLAAETPRTARGTFTARSQPPRSRSVPTPTPGKHPIRTSLREDILLHVATYEPPVDYNTRTSFDLRRIVEDQWRKELQEREEEEEKQKQKELEEQQKEEIREQKEKEERKAKKLGKKANGKKN
ncbi:TMEM232 [Branchiostoma lanceolatum]|uniref:TMEM232 protein n=1 Tax=Branchiostoma lanceolatum TaxID=7740 RepID=A0A8J9ZEQ0_BRALA|nr:TMEM232 [Branchiostoma lanceolatum]